VYIGATEYHKQKLRVVCTLAATVMVLPEAEEFDVQIDYMMMRVDFFVHQDLEDNR
jgi:protein subunit release factor A